MRRVAWPWNSLAWKDPESSLRQPPVAGAAWNAVPLQEATVPEPLLDEDEGEVMERKRWQEWAKHAAEQERQRRIKVGRRS